MGSEVQYQIQMSHAPYQIKYKRVVFQIRQISLVLVYVLYITFFIKYFLKN